MLDNFCIWVDVNPSDFLAIEIDHGPVIGQNPDGSYPLVWKFLEFEPMKEVGGDRFVGRVVSKVEHGVLIAVAVPGFGGAGRPIIGCEARVFPVARRRCAAVMVTPILPEADEDVWRLQDP